MDLTINTAHPTIMDAIVFAWLEADRLDNGEYDEWLSMWTPDARYIVPVEPGVTDFKAHLNYAYDDHAMREKRIERMLSGVSVSASPLAVTARSLSRFRLLSDDGETIELRCMQRLTEFRRGRSRDYAANVEFRLKREPSGLKIDQKVIRLINADHALGGISYIL
ncbi:aromatic-ring-hydroxylating dioxygenase subunit beta [Phyllobacterium sp. YR531]|uniref:aromatic-ring-hydroxylating dioxygenase subunit beta n=1 Tax=Phyllobacterium sp. YR531 TaxID=1144343 RepID=UPI00026FBA79|nr:aromatic-ring-hydroxylating dioxygenase subunit beta [Phyllobacterium sp. YR531]EJN05843.1 small subunit of phenylpropionate dioxygenase [Phyllobacterium sp. YR531]